MSGLAHGARVVVHMARASALAQMQYRADFLLQLGMAVFWVAWNVAPAVLVFRIRPEIAGFSLDEAMLVIAAFLVLRAALEGIVNPNLQQIIEHVRAGTLDFVLLKPVDSQLLVSLTKIVPSKLVDLASGLLVGAWAIARLDPTPPPSAILAGLVMLLAGVAVLYSIWMLVLCSAFFFIRVDNLSFLFTSIFDAARWPIDVFRGWVRWVLTWVLPVAVMTSFPALAILGRLDASAALGALGAALVALLGSRLAWRLSVRHYGSASS